MQGAHAARGTRGSGNAPLRERAAHLLVIRRVILLVICGQGLIPWSVSIIPCIPAAAWPVDA